MHNHSNAGGLKLIFLYMKSCAPKPKLTENIRFGRNHIRIARLTAVYIHPFLFISV